MNTGKLEDLPILHAEVSEDGSSAYIVNVREVIHEMKVENIPRSESQFIYNGAHFKAVLAYVEGASPEGSVQLRIHTLKIEGTRVGIDEDNYRDLKFLSPEEALQNNIKKDTVPEVKNFLTRSDEAPKEEPKEEPMEEPTEEPMEEPTDFPEEEPKEEPTGELLTLEQVDYLLEKWPDNEDFKALRNKLDPPTVSGVLYEIMSKPVGGLRSHKAMHKAIEEILSDPRLAIVLT